MTVEKLQKAKELKDELDSVNGIMEMLGGRLGSGKLNDVNLDYVKFHQCDGRPAERLHDIPLEVCKEITQVLHNYYLTRQRELTKEWEEL